MMKTCLKTSLCLLLGILMILGSSCSIYQERKTADPTYMSTRKKIIKTPRIKGTEEYEVYTVIVDMDHGDHVETLACYADGKTEMYFSTGESYLQLDKDRPALAQATQALMKGLEEHLDAAARLGRTELALPKAGLDKLYFVTDIGLYTMIIDPARLSESSEALQSISALYNAVYDLAIVDCVPQASAQTQAAT